MAGMWAPILRDRRLVLKFSIWKLSEELAGMLNLARNCNPHLAWHLQNVEAVLHAPLSL